MWSTRVGEKSVAMMKRNAKPVPRGTVIWQENGRLFMARAGMWDRNGNFMPSGLNGSSLPPVPLATWAARPGGPFSRRDAPRASQDRDHLRPDRDHADEQRQRHQGGASSMAALSIGFS